MRKQLELVQEVEQYYLDNQSSEPVFRKEAGLGNTVGILKSTRLSASVLVNDRVASMWLQVGEVLSILVAYAPNSSADYCAFFESWDSVLKWWYPGGERGDIWWSRRSTGRFQHSPGQGDQGVIGRNGLISLIWTQAVLCSLAFMLALAISSSMFEHKVAHMCTLYHNTLGQRFCHLICSRIFR